MMEDPSQSPSTPQPALCSAAPLPEGYVVLDISQLGVTAQCGAN